MDPIAKTAYYCCGIRALDAASAHPICGDTFAQRFMSEEGRDIFSRFADLTAPNRSNVTRARIVDDILRQRLRQKPEQRVILLGAGFDSRAFRLTGGRWVELDHPAVIAIKSRVLPVEETQNALLRISIDFATDKLADKLKPIAGEEQVIVILEGVSMYLTEEQLRSTLSVLRQMLPRHILIADLMAGDFGRRYGGEIRKRIAAFGGRFGPFIENPAQLITASGYSEVSRQSIVGRARELGAFRMPGFLFNILMRPLRDGYQVHVFNAN